MRRPRSPFIVPFPTSLPITTAARLILIAVLMLRAAGSASPNETGIQFEGTAAYNFVEALPSVSPSETRGFLYNAKTSARWAIFDSLAFVLNHRLIAAQPDSLFPEKQYPIDNYVYAGLATRGIGKLNLGASNTVTPRAKSYSTPWNLPATRTTPDMLNSIDGDWEISNDNFTAAASAGYFMYNYKLTPGDNFVDSLVANSAPFGSHKDVDLWADLSAEASTPLDVSIVAGGMTKQDMNEYDGYNIHEIRSGLSGSHQLNRNRIKWDWSATERFVESAVMQGNGYAVGLSTRLISRIIWRMQKNLFVKAGGRLEAAQNLHKLFLEAQARRTWDNGSSLDVCYFGTSGVLFPRHGMRIACRLSIHPRFGLAPSLEGYINRFNASGFRYYRSDATLESLFPVTRRIEMFLGGKYRHYDRHPLFASRATVFGGLRTW